MKILMVHWSVFQIQAVVWLDGKLEYYLWRKTWLGVWLKNYMVRVDQEHRLFREGYILVFKQLGDPRRPQFVLSSWKGW